MEQNNTYITKTQNTTAAGTDMPQTSSGFTNTQIPQPSLPKGGGAIKSIDDKFKVNPANGTSGSAISLPFSPSRNGFMPELSLSYSSGSGNSAYGLGWNAEPAAIARTTGKKLPQYQDVEKADTFSLSGAEDLVPLFVKDDSDNWIKDTTQSGTLSLTRYRPRIESGFVRIEQITEANGNVYWQTTSGGNVITIFGKSKSAQVYDPTDPSKIFKWLVEFSCDDKGNCYQYEYKKEDKINVPNFVHEKNRLSGLSNCTNAYLKRIKYCNKIHFRRSAIDLINWEAFLAGIEYLLEMVFDYGEHNQANPQPNDTGGWACRTDPFSDYRAGFEIRTYRLCSRVLMFHRFAELGAQPCLVRSLNLGYTANNMFTFLTSATQKGYIKHGDGTYTEKSMPPVEYNYEKLGWDTTVKSIPAASQENLPMGIDNVAYQWIDLYNEGISGILSEQAVNWYYKRNNGDGKFDGVKLVARRPSLSGVASGELYFQDIDAKGQLFLVSRDLHGYYELNDENEWLQFRNFSSFPNIDLRNPNVKFIDLNGDGKTDILISQDEVFTWFASNGKAGFDSYKTVRKAFDEEKGPNIIFADATQFIAIADMTGDGLMDIIRIRNSEVVYWPNLGYGKFGAKVTMNNAPVFDKPESFNPRLIKLADVDGSGNTSIIYLGRNSFKVYFNQAGNSWSDQNIVNGVNPVPFPQIDEYSTVSVIDLLGNGTACVVWSSPLPRHAANPLFYIDLMGGRKPYVMISTRNNMGAETHIQYKPSTYYYLQDKNAGTPWITKLPFPVQCVSTVEYLDLLAKTRFISQYSYHHGYYDHAEREFRGFGRVDQTDTEDFDNYKKHADLNGRIQIVDEGFHQPPALSKTWFHTGAFLDKEKILDQFAQEYYKNDLIPEKQLADPPLPFDLTTEEWREALRACKGIPLRAEVYTLDGTDKQKVPYSATTTSCLIQLVQPTLQNAYSVWQVQQSESLAYVYERNPADPRIAHTMVLETNMYGNVLKSAMINYGRKTVDPDLTPAEQAEQSKTHVVISESSFTNSINTTDEYLLPAGYKNSGWELTGTAPANGDYYSITEIKNYFNTAVIIPYEVQPATGRLEKRLLSQSKSLFLKNNLSGPLPEGIIESLGLPYQSFKLALTSGIIANTFGDKITSELLINEGKYVHLNNDDFWLAGGTVTLDALNFYQPEVFTDSFGYTAKVTYDANYRYFVEQTITELENTTHVTGFNYRTLSPCLPRISMITGQGYAQMSWVW